MAFVLTVAGTAYDRAGRAANRIVMSRHRWDLDQADALEFAVRTVGAVGPFTPGMTVGLSRDGVPTFLGEIASAHVGRDGKGYAVGYACRGLKAVADRISITNPGYPAGEFAYNLPPDDPDYLPASAGLTVGQILQLLLDAHAAPLVAAGVGTAGAGGQYLAADLAIAALAVVPPEAVRLSGPLMAAIDGLLDSWAGVCSCYLEWQAGTADWRVRIVDATAFADQTLTFGVDPVDPPDLDRDADQCASRVVVRGSGNIQGALVSLTNGSLAEDFTNPTYATNAAAKAAWNLAAFTNPAGAVDGGTVVSVTGNSATVRSSSATAAFAANYWNGAILWLENTAATDLTGFDQRRITASTALTAGGTYTITWDSTLPADSGTFTNYRVVGSPVNGLTQCWRRYKVVNPAIAAALVKRSPYPIPFATASTVQQVQYPVAMVWYHGAMLAVPFQLDIAAGGIVFNQPTVAVFGSTQNLQLGGSHTDGIPDDVQAFLLFNKGTLQVACPADTVGYGGVHAPNYQGTSYAVDGIARTWDYDVGDGFSYLGDTPSMQALACMLLATVQDTVVTGTVKYHGLPPAWASAHGNRLSIAANYGATYTTGWEALKCPIRGVDIAWAEAGSGDVFETSFHLNNRRKRATGDRLYTHPHFELRDRQALDSLFLGGAVNGLVGEVGLADWGKAAGVPPPGAAGGAPTAEGVADAVRGYAQQAAGNGPAPAGHTEGGDDAAE